MEIRRARGLLALLLASCGDNLGPPDGALDESPDLGSVPGACVSGRALEDRADDSARDQIRILYVIPADVDDRERDTSGQICNSVRSFAGWFQAHSSRYLRLDTMNGAIDIGFVRLEQNDAQMRGSDPSNASLETGIAFVRNRIELALARRGMIAANKLYAVYYEGSSTWACGGGAYPPLIVDRVGAMYLRGQPVGQAALCGDVLPWGRTDLVPNYIDYGALHEVIHSMGIVAAGAPNEHSTGHVYDPGAAEPARDLMYSPRVGMPDPYWAVDHPGGLLLDLGSDDYLAELDGMSLLAPLSPEAHRPSGW